MKIPDDVREFVKDVMAELNVPDTDENRQSILRAVINVGAQQLLTVKGLFVAMKSEFKTDPMYERPGTETIQPTPSVCPQCDVPVVHNGYRYVCNCRVWQSPPEKEKDGI